MFHHGTINVPAGTTGLLFQTPGGVPTDITILRTTGPSTSARLCGDPADTTGWDLSISDTVITGLVGSLYVINPSTTFAATITYRASNIA